jgi:hypothetical protein
MSSVKMIEENISVIVEHLVKGNISKEDFDISFKFIVDKARDEHRREIMAAYCSAASDPGDLEYWPSLDYYNETFNTNDK